MKNLQEYINEGLLSGKKIKRIGGMKVPVEMPDKYKDFISNYFSNLDDVDDARDVEKYMRLADEFWDMVINDFKLDPYKYDDTWNIFWPVWKNEIINIALEYYERY